MLCLLSRRYDCTEAVLQSQLLDSRAAVNTVPNVESLDTLYSMHYVPHDR
jgi:hypothetical protein